MFRAAIVILSDKGARGERRDQSGDVIRGMLESIGGQVVDYAVLPDEKEVIIEKLVELSDRLGVDLVVTSGGTGLAPRDVTPEATAAVVERVVPGMAEAMRAYGMQKTPRAMLSRGMAGLRGRTLIVNVPGSPRGARESLEAIMGALEHGLNTLAGRDTECARE
ncbi:MAG: MogA/MoaB family molybdenum cofactor biosynthesis protein [Syntrophomonadaceae bacterium]|jgi:molybdenum cofactor synthesis domain-containing protein|nr:MogA/MoaB family molybdenum cofactor biosynthesis protein [Syntrophomonadaceae bacterium]MDH7497626.1 MogA/MoaB family molybdenum cofactor biosynthesis protein [Syntrophomonadaceae bacterium]